MTRHKLFGCAMILAAGVVSAQEPYDHAAEWAFQRQVLTNRSNGQFQEVNWRKDAATAVKDAQASGKPVLVFIKVNKHGQQDASDC